MSTALVANQPDPKRRSVVRYTVNDPTSAWMAVATWATTTGFRPVQPQTIEVKRYQKGDGMITVPTIAELTLRGNVMELQVWLQISFLSRLFTFFLMPSEMNVASGGFRAVIPRGIARRAVNMLLAGVGAQEIS